MLIFPASCPVLICGYFYYVLYYPPITLVSQEPINALEKEFFGILGNKEKDDICKWLNIF